MPPPRRPCCRFKAAASEIVGNADSNFHNRQLACHQAAGAQRNISAGLPGVHRVRQIVASGWYRQLFPATRRSPQRAAMPEFDTTAQGCRLATWVGGVLTGTEPSGLIKRAPDVFGVLDDPVPNSRSERSQQKRRVMDIGSRRGVLPNFLAR